jgi:predicted phage terminase large subunit-like protein
LRRHFAKLKELPMLNDPNPAQIEALQAIQKRVVKDHFTEFCRYATNLIPARHHQLIIDRLERVQRGEIKRLLLVLPPGAGKSTYVSTLYPVWHLANNPKASIIACSHTAELAARWGRQVRNYILEYGAELGLSLRGDSMAADRWAVEEGGEYFAIGTGGAVLGFRADLIILDDPIRSREDAFSETIRQSLWDWYSTVLYSRLKPKGALVLISTRWHLDDLVGRIELEAERTGEVWHKLILPAMAEQDDVLGRAPGQFLWDDDAYGYPETLKAQFARLPPMDWAAMYQGRPAPETGDFFKLDWLKSFDQMPDRKTLRIYAASDYAISAGKGDWTVHLVVGVDPAGHLYLLDLYRKQVGPGIWVEDMLAMAKQWSPIAWAIEKGQISGTVGPFLEKRMRERKIPLFLRPFASKHDKSTRAQSIRGYMSLHGLYVNTKASYYPAFQEEILSFPAARHDDQVDALGLIGQLFDQIQPGQMPRKDAKVALPRDYVEISDDKMLERAARDPEFTLHEIIEDDYGGSNLKLL